MLRQLRTHYCRGAAMFFGARYLTPAVGCTPHKSFLNRVDLVALAMVVH
jgi:hypothetical protein